MTQRAPQSAAAQSSAQRREFTIRIPKTNDQQRFYSILKFSGSLNVDPTKWTREQLKMAREDNRRQYTDRSGEVQPEFGAGSEYGRKAREEARRKRYGRNTRQYEHDQQPWMLSIKPPETTSTLSDGEQEGQKAVAKKERRFRSIRESGATEYADYWVFVKTGPDDFEAFKVDDWYQFLPAVDRQKVLDEDQAEERFAQRDKVLNQLALKAQIRKQLEADEEPDLVHSATRSTQKLVIRDRDEDRSGESASDGDDEGDGDEEGNRKKPQKAKKKAAKGRGKRGKKEEERDAFARVESDDGDEEGRELDYISDTEESSDDDIGPPARKAENQGAEGAATQQTVEGDEDESEMEDEDEEEEGAEEGGKRREGDEDEDGNQEDEEEERLEAQHAARKSRKMLTKRLSAGESAAASLLKGVQMPMELDGDGEKEESGDEGSSSDEDLDKAPGRSLLFLAPVASSEGGSNQQQTGSQTAGSNGGARKRPADEAGDQKVAVDPKKQRIEKAPSLPPSQQSATSSTASGIQSTRPALTLPLSVIQDLVRKMLKKRPHSTRELVGQLQEVKGTALIGTEPSAKWTKHERTELVNRLSEILKLLKPYQFSKEIDGKPTLYFSLTKSKE